ncbi:MAG: 50S ribosomal protein L7/L12, partial [Candidatus Shapirobacteria bacterium]
MADTKIDKLLDQIGELSVIELSDLVKALEEKFDVK